MLHYWPLLLVSFAGGICAAYYDLGLIILPVGIILWLIARHYPQHRSHMVLIIVTLAGSMFYYHLVGIDTPAQLPSHRQVELSGRVLGVPYYDGEKTNFALQVDTDNPYQEKIRVVCLFQSPYHRGDVVKLRGDLQPPRKPGNPGAFDYPTYLAHQGIYYNLTVQRAAQTSLISPVSGPLKWVDDFRRRAEEITREVLTPEEASILLGMIMGGKAGMEDEQYEDFQKTGIVHLFSVGGLHVGFLLVLINWLCSLGRLQSRGKFIIGVTALLIYGTMVAWPPPVIRAVLMGSLGLLAYLSGRENSLLNALAISGLVILLISPTSLFSLSFQLTVLATLGIVYLFPLFRKRLPYKGLGWDMILIPISVELTVLPLVAYHFNLFTPVSILTNILITYFSGGAVILGFLAFLLSPLLPAASAVLLYPSGMLIELILLVVGWMKMVPGAYIWVATPLVGMVILYYAALGLAIWSIQDSCRIRFLKPALALLLTFMILLLVPAGCYHRGDLEVTFIDVGQGDAILLKSPRGKFILVDGGGSRLYDVGSVQLLPYLHHRGVRQLDMIINTHPDIDHLQGLERAAQEIDVKYIGVPGNLMECDEYTILRNIAATRKIPLLSLATGQRINLEKDLVIEVLHPPAGIYSGDDYNPESVVLQIAYGDFSALLTGDITASNMPMILSSVKKPPVFVKVPHHGSKDSLYPGFYEELQARYAVICVAANNPFGHPHPLVLEALEEQGIEILRTDLDGAVTIFSDGRKMIIERTIE